MSENKIEAAAAVLEAMGGADVTAEAPAAETQVAQPKAKKAAAKKPAAKKAKKPEAPKRPGPKTLACLPTNTKHKVAGGGEIEIVKTRVSYLIRLPEKDGKPGRLKWVSSLKVQAMVESKAAVAAEHEEAETSEDPAAA